MELKVENLTKRYGGRTVLDGVSFTLREGVTCLMAPCGSCWGWKRPTAGRSRALPGGG